VVQVGQACVVQLCVLGQSVVLGGGIFPFVHGLGLCMNVCGRHIVKKTEPLPGRQCWEKVVVVFYKGFHLRFTVLLYEQQNGGLGNFEDYPPNRPRGEVSSAAIHLQNGHPSPSRGASHRLCAKTAAHNVLPPLTSGLRRPHNTTPTPIEFVPHMTPERTPLSVPFRAQNQTFAPNYVHYYYPPPPAGDR